MEIKTISRLGGLLFLIASCLTKAQEDSLRSALNAVDRRQKDLSDFARYEDDNVGDYGYSLDSPDDLAFLSSPDYTSSDRELEKNAAFERLLLDYLKEGSSPVNSPHISRDYGRKKGISSSFRERLEEDRERQLDDTESEADEDSDDYSEAVRELWHKYKNYPALYNRPRIYLNDDIEKRAYYPPIYGPETVGLRKRSKYAEDNPEEYVYSYAPQRLQDDNDIEASYYEWENNKRYGGNRQRNINSYQIKRFPISKRSGSKSNFGGKSEIIHEHKRSTSKKEAAIKTDPEVARDLSNIFGTVSTEQPTTVTTTTVQPEKSTKKPNKKEQSTKDKDKFNNKAKPGKSNRTQKQGSKEEVSDVMTDRPLDIKKKSIDWSDYFGLDRRKKSDEGLDNEWLMERYHKAIAMTTKRNAEYPLQSFKNHDQPSNKKEPQGPVSNDGVHKKDKFTPDESKISEMDKKLKNMEDSIIDDALKYTGSHEGTVDSKEIQEVKDRVISRLAAAYNIEKMRRALSEYKVSIAKERERLKHQRKTNEDFDILEEKRVSVPRKQAVDEDREKIPEGDNSIKCAHGDEDCEEQNYRTPTEILQQTTFEECPKVQRACSEVSTVLGHYARVFETACNMHQMCLLCSNNSWFSPTRQCNALFLTKAFELCDGNQECQKEAQRSVRYLLDVNRSLRMEPFGECELACPDKR